VRPQHRPCHGGEPDSRACDDHDGQRVILGVPSRATELVCSTSAQVGISFDRLSSAAMLLSYSGIPSGSLSLISRNGRRWCDPLRSS